MQITHLDHFVLTVKDISATVHFYESVVGMTSERFAGDRVCLRFGDQKINLHQAGAEFAPHAAEPTPGSADLCFIIDDGLTAAMAHVEACGVAIIEGPVARSGATGPITSFYFRDPDGNLIEIARYTLG